jgi:hypothetical protein
MTVEEPEHVYHIYQHELLARQSPFARIRLRMPRGEGKGRGEVKLVQSLCNDMAELRRMGAAKGIVDASETKAGLSVHGRELLLLKVGKGAKHKVLITGGHHGNEWSSVEVPYLIAKYLIESYTEDPSQEEQDGKPVDDAGVAERKRIKHLLDNRQIWFIPLVNPDGHYRAMTSDRMWRKNCRTYVVPAKPERDLPPAELDGQVPPAQPEGAATLVLIDGVDINRNYPTLSWGQGKDKLTMWWGPTPGSEPETRAVAALIRQHRFKASISYHNYGMDVFYFHRDPYVRHVAAALGTLLNQVVAEEQKHAPVRSDGTQRKLPHYKVSDGTTGVPSTGHIADYCYEHAPGQPTLGLELPPKWDDGVLQNYGYTWVREATLDRAFRESLPAALALINSAGFSQPPAEVKVCADAGTQVVQVVDHYADAFNDWKLGTGE